MTDPIFPCIWFDKGAKEAADFYCSVFKNSKIIEEQAIGRAVRIGQKENVIVKRFIMIMNNLVIEIFIKFILNFLIFIIHHSLNVRNIFVEMWPCNIKMFVSNFIKHCIFTC